MKRSRAVYLALLLATLSVFSTAGPARGDTGGGNIDFLLTATLPTYPCGNPGCINGSFSGSSLGALAGVNGSIPWHVEWLGSAAGTFKYLDSCDIPVGTAEGSGNLAATVGMVNGDYGTPSMGDPFPYPVVGIAVNFTFIWTRIGVSAVVTTRVNVTLTVAAPSGFQSIPVVTDHVGVALAAFAPTGAPPTCAAPGGITAIVVGADALAA